MAASQARSLRAPVFSGLLYIPSRALRTPTPFATLSGKATRELKRQPLAGIEPGLPTMFVLRTGYSSKGLARQLQIRPLELTIWLESPIMGENPRNNAAVLVKERQSASQR